MRTVGPLLVLLALAGCGGGGDAQPEEPGAFAQRVVRQLAEGDAGAAWDELHPDQQESVPRRLYTRCEGQDGLGELDGLEVTGVREEPAVVPGSGEQPSTASRSPSTSTASPSRSTCTSSTSTAGGGG